MTVEKQDRTNWLEGQTIHPQRDNLTQELHARPYVPMPTPLDVFLFAKYTGEDAADYEYQNLLEFCKANNSAVPTSGARHHKISVGDHCIRWERHGEFTTYTLHMAASDTAPFEKEVPSYMLDWLKTTRGELLVATHLSIRQMDDELYHDELMHKIYESESMVCSKIANGAAQVWTDVQIHSSGFNRILVLNRKLKEITMGRVAQCLMDISTYRNMALLALPVAQKTANQIVSLDTKLSELLDQLSDSSRDESTLKNPIDNDSHMLQELTNLSMTIQRLSAQARNRLNAADAYYALINSRLNELSEESVAGYQTIGEFIQRRLSPAMRTCNSVQTRLENLSKRTSRAVDLLRTRLDLTLERQNHNLLESMNKRVLVQMRLQETVEGLSIAAITYYIVGLIGYLAKSTHSLGLGLTPETITGLSVAPIAFSVWFGIRQVKKKIHSIGYKTNS